MPPRLRYDGGLDRVLEAIQHPARRQVLVALLKESSTNTDASSSVQLQMEDHRRFGFDDDAIETTLRHIHLPKLDDYGYISWDGPTGTVAPGPAWDTIEPVLSLLDDHQDDLPGEWV